MLDENQVLGAMCKAMSMCPVHHTYVLADIKTMLLPPIRHQQYKFFEGAGQYGVITWAFLNSQAAAKHVENLKPLSYDEWKSGSDLWIISLIGHRIRPNILLSKLAASFPVSEAFYLRRDSDHNVRKIIRVKKEASRLQVCTIAKERFSLP